MKESDLSLRNACATWRPNRWKRAGSERRKRDYFLLISDAANRLMILSTYSIYGESHQQTRLDAAWLPSILLRLRTKGKRMFICTSSILRPLTSLRYAPSTPLVTFIVATTENRRRYSQSKETLSPCPVGWTASGHTRGIGITFVGKDKTHSTTGSASDTHKVAPRCKPRARAEVEPQFHSPAVLAKLAEAGWPFIPRSSLPFLV